jgi:TolB-like protein
MRVGLLAALVASVGLLVGQTGVAHAQTVRVAMLPIAVNSSLSETDYLSTGLADMLTARLEQSGQIAVTRLDGSAPDRATAIEAGKKAGVEFVLFGSYTQFGDGASLDLRCVEIAGDASDEPRRVFIQAGSPAEIIPKLGDLSESVTRYLVGAAGSTSAPAAANPSATTPTANSELADLQQRIEALERVVFSAPVASAPAPSE